MTNAKEAADDGNVPPMTVTVSASHSTGFPGERLRVEVKGDNLEGQRPLKLHLVDEMGISVAEELIVNHSAELMIPQTAEIGDYSLRVKSGPWSLDSVPFEIAQKRVAILTRKLLLASMRQAEAFDALNASEPDVDRAFDLAQESEKLYIEADGPKLASETWAELSEVLRGSGFANRAEEAASRAARLDGGYGDVIGVQSRTSPGGRRPRELPPDKARVRRNQMVGREEPFSELKDKNLKAAVRLAQLSIENSQRIMELQVQTAKSLFEEGVQNAKALTTVKEPKEMVDLRAAYAQSIAEKMLSCARAIAEIAASTQAEVGKMVSEQLSTGSDDIFEVMQKMFKARPTADQNAIGAIQAAKDTTREAFEKMSRESNLSFQALTHRNDQTLTQQSGKARKK